MVDFSRSNIVPGIYRRFDGKKIQVVLLTRDIDSEEEIVLCKEGESYYTISGRSFRSYAEIDKRLVDKYVFLKETGQNESEKSRRTYRSESTYYGYAKDLCEHYMEDMRKYSLCMSEKRFLDITKEEFLIIKEDLTFLQNCLKTVLRPYADYFKGRYVERLSIRKYAEAHNLNRGSVHHTQKKLYSAFAEALKARDEADQTCRLRLSSLQEEESV